MAEGSDDDDVDNEDDNEDDEGDPIVCESMLSCPRRTSSALAASNTVLASAHARSGVRITSLWNTDTLSANARRTALVGGSARNAMESAAS